MTVMNLSEETLSSVQALVDFHRKVNAYAIRVAWVLERTEVWSDQLDLLDYLHKDLDSLSSSLDRPAAHVSLWLSSGNDSDLGERVGAAVLASEGFSVPLEADAAHVAAANLGGEASTTRGGHSGDRDPLGLSAADQAGEPNRSTSFVAVSGEEGGRPVGVGC